MRGQWIVSILASCCMEASLGIATPASAGTNCIRHTADAFACTQTNAANVDRMIDRSWFWLERKRIDQSRNVLRKALHVDASNPIILQRLVEIESESGRMDLASTYLKRLASARDVKRYQAALESFTIFRAHKREISQARLLDRNGRYARALGIWNGLISGVPKGHLALDILPLRARFGDAEAVMALQSLATEFDPDPRYAGYRSRTATIPVVAQGTEPAARQYEPAGTAPPKPVLGGVPVPVSAPRLALAMSDELGAPEPAETDPDSSGQQTMAIFATDTAIVARFAQHEPFVFPEPAPVKPALDTLPASQPPSWAWQLTRKWLNNPGTPGVSDLNQTIDLLHVERDSDSSRMQFWLEDWRMNGGSAEGNADFGTATAGTPSWTLSAQGVGLGLAYETKGWRVDLGHTPPSFAINYPVFGIRKSWEQAGSEMTAEFTRRPLSESILSFAGARDPASGRTWGGAKATGVKLTYDRAIDAWDIGAKAAFHRIDGNDIVDNRKLDLALKATYRFTPWTGTRLKAGMQLAHWRYSENTNYYRYGHAGYYSPQKYYSIDLPLELAGETGRHSYRLTGGVTYSHKQARDVAEFPLSRTGDVFKGSSGYASGWYLSATWEYRLTNAWAMGLRIAQDNSPYYEPTSMMLYLRYDASGKLRWRATYPRDSYFKE